MEIDGCRVKWLHTNWSKKNNTNYQFPSGEQYHGKWETIQFYMRDTHLKFGGKIDFFRITNLMMANMPIQKERHTHKHKTKTNNHALQRHEMELKKEKKQSRKQILTW